MVWYLAQKLCIETPVRIRGLLFRINEIITSFGYGLLLRRTPGRPRLASGGAAARCSLLGLVSRMGWAVPIGVATAQLSNVAPGALVDKVRTSVGGSRRLGGSHCHPWQKSGAGLGLVVPRQVVRTAEFAVLTS